MEFTIADFTRAVTVSIRLGRYARQFIERLKSNCHARTVRPYPTRFGKSLWLGLGVVGWLLSRFFRRRRKTFLPLTEQAERHPSQRIISVPATKHAKSGGGILTLAIELLAAVAISLAQRYVKSWRSALVVQITNSPYRSKALSFHQDWSEHNP